MKKKSMKYFHEYFQKAIKELYFFMILFFFQLLFKLHSLYSNTSFY